MHAETIRDTLFIQIKTNELGKKYKDEEQWVLLSGVNLYLHTSHVDVNTSINYPFKVDIGDIETDTILVKSKGHVYIRSCTADVVGPLYGSFTLKDSKMKVFNMDFDVAHSWKQENCDIEMENFTGSGSHKVSVTKGRIRNWIPKSKNTSLQVTLRGGTEPVVIR